MRAPRSFPGAMNRHSPSSCAPSDWRQLALRSSVTSRDGVAPTGFTGALVSRRGGSGLRGGRARTSSANGAQRRHPTTAAAAADDDAVKSRADRGPAAGVRRRHGAADRAAARWPAQRTANSAGTSRVLDEHFHTMGTVARVVRDADGEVDVRSFFAEIDRRLSRFDASSDLCRLNADPRASVPAGPLLRGRGRGRAARRDPERRPRRSDAPGCAASMPVTASRGRTSRRHRWRRRWRRRHSVARLGPTRPPDGARWRSTTMPA